jgi:Fur family ferric uptake transcriptional regulator
MSEPRRKTRQREAILHVLEHAKRPLRVPEILELAQQDVPKLGVATVYRTVSRLQEEELIQAVELPGENPCYELRGGGHRHYFRCNICERVFTIRACPGDLEKLLPPGFKLEDHEIVLYGRCVNCA